MVHIVQGMSPLEEEMAEEQQYQQQQQQQQQEQPEPLLQEQPEPHDLAQPLSDSSTSTSSSTTASVSTSASDGSMPPLETPPQAARVDVVPDAPRRRAPSSAERQRARRANRPPAGLNMQPSVVLVRVGTTRGKNKTLFY